MIFALGSWLEQSTSSAWLTSWTNSLLAMRYDQPRWRQLMDLEGLKRWIRPDATILEGYRVLFEAVEKQRLALYASFVARRASKGCPCYRVGLGRSLRQMHFPSNFLQ